MPAAVFIISTVLGWSDSDNLVGENPPGNGLPGTLYDRRLGCCVCLQCRPQRGSMKLPEIGHEDVCRAVKYFIFDGHRYGLGRWTYKRILHLSVSPCLWGKCSSGVTSGLLIEWVSEWVMWVHAFSVPVLIVHGGAGGIVANGWLPGRHLPSISTSSRFQN